MTMEIIHIILFVVIAVIMSAISYFLGVSKFKLKKQSLENQLDNAFAEKERLEMQCEALHSEKEKAEFYNNELKAENNNLMIQNSEFSRNVAVLSNEKSSLETKINEQLADKIKLETKHNELEAVNDDLVAKNAEVTRNLAVVFSDKNGLEAKIKECTIEKAKLEDKYNELVNLYNVLVKQNSTLNSELAVSNNKNINLSKEIDELKQNFENTEKQFKESFENIASKILEDRIKTINKDGEGQIKKSIEPLEKELTEFKARIEAIYLNETRERASISKELENLLKLNRQLSSDADSLARAIKGENNPKMQGDWGEMILDTILSNSGLKRDEHYFAQESTTDEDGVRKRPDIIVRYPDKREIIIDSKVSLTAFSRYVSAVSEDEREEAIKNHILSIRRHVDDLASKQYDNRENSLDFVMMFIPVEPAYILALNSDNTLWEYAYKRKIIIITPTHLITALKLIYDLWSRDAQNRNAIDIASRGAAMYDKFVGFVTDMQTIGTSLDKTRKSYDLALNKLSTGKGNLVRQAEMLKELGVRTSKELNITANELVEPSETTEITENNKDNN